MNRVNISEVQIANKNILKIILKWGVLSIIVGVLTGSVSALFLVSLNWVTDYRELHSWVIWLLPLCGLGIGFCYHYYGKDIVKGNNLIIEEFLNPQKKIHIKMTPMIFIATIATHLFGGSAGREGTAVQMGGSIADQFTNIFKLNNQERKILLIIGISAGFASIFGTPYAGAVFALEVLLVGRFGFQAILPSVLTALIADYTCTWWNVMHTKYEIPSIPNFQFNFIWWAIIVGIVCGLTALLFSKSVYFFENQFKEKINSPVLRPVIGGAIIALAVYLMHTTKYIGLGIPTIQESFISELPPYDFLLKIAFTAYTLVAGFKGGEATPLFFIGATLGNALSFFIPLPIALLAGMGFVAVFAGSTNTPIACTIMGIELFGLDCGIFVGIACLVAYFFSGPKGIYTSQPQTGIKYFLYKKIFKERSS